MAFLFRGILFADFTEHSYM